MPPPPRARIQSGTGTFMSMVEVLRTWTMAASGPTELATSLAPWAKATEQELITTMGTNIRSTASSCSPRGSSSRPWSFLRATK